MFFLGIVFFFFTFYTYTSNLPTSPYNNLMTIDDENTGDWTSWWTWLGYKKDEKIKDDEKITVSSYSKNQQTLSSLKSYKQNPNKRVSNNRKESSSTTLVRSDSSNSSLSSISIHHQAGIPVTPKITRRLQLTNDNLVIYSPVPSVLSKALSYNDHHEFSHVRYTAVTCDPDVFMSQGYKLRPTILKRETEIFIAITMYNVKPSSILCYFF